MRILLVNPNISAGITEAIRRRAESVARPGTAIEAATAAFGPAYISTRAENAIAAHAMLDAMARAAHASHIDGAVVGAFTDAGLLAARDIFPFPVTGMVEAGMAAAARGGRRFAVITAAPALAGVIDGLAAGYGHGDLFAGTLSLDHGAVDLAGDLRGAVGPLAALAGTAVRARGAEAVLLGGAPLAPLAQAIEQAAGIPVVEGIAAAVRRLEALGPGAGGERPSRPAGKPCKGLAPELAAAMGLSPLAEDGHA